MDGSYCVKPLKQKQVVRICFSSALLLAFLRLQTRPSLTRASVSEVFFSSLQVDGVSYLLQEIYGIENKYNSQESKVNAGVGGSDAPASASASARPC